MSNVKFENAIQFQFFVFFELTFLQKIFLELSIQVFSVDRPCGVCLSVDKHYCAMWSI